jgi:hypothetical protein
MGQNTGPISAGVWKQGRDMDRTVIRLGTHSRSKMCSPNGLLERASVYAHPSFRKPAHVNCFAFGGRRCDAVPVAPRIQPPRLGSFGAETILLLPRNESSHESLERLVLIGAVLRHGRRGTRSNGPGPRCPVGERVSSGQHGSISHATAAASDAFARCPGRYPSSGRNLRRG